MKREREREREIINDPSVQYLTDSMGVCMFICMCVCVCVCVCTQHVIIIILSL